jgi:hypothetical protein
MSLHAAKGSPMRYCLRTLLIATAVIPPVASLVWWLVFRTELLPPTLEAAAVIVPIGAVTLIVIAWLDELAEYLSRRRA